MKRVFVEFGRLLFCLAIGLFIAYPHWPVVILFTVVALLGTLSIWDQKE